MSEKTVIKPEQVVSRKGGKITYINDQSTLVNASEDSVTVQSDEPKPDEATAEEIEFIAESAEPTPEVPPHVVEATENPKPETETPKPVKGKKSKETKVATAAAKKAPAKATKPAPKKNVPSKAPKEAGVRTIGGKPVDISEYKKAKAPGGGTSLNNGDAVAEMLEGKDLDACYKVAAQKLKEDEKVLRKKYGHLNVGMQRMNLGNRLRKVLIPKAAK